MWREIGLWALALAVIFILGRVWFHLAEGIRARVQSLLNRHREPPVWHAFEETGDEKNGDAPDRNEKQGASGP